MFCWCAAIFYGQFWQEGGQAAQKIRPPTKPEIYTRNPCFLEAHKVFQNLFRSHFKAAPPFHIEEKSKKCVLFVVAVRERTLTYGVLVSLTFYCAPRGPCSEGINWSTLWHLLLKPKRRENASKELWNSKKMFCKGIITIFRRAKNLAKSKGVLKMH